jgi:hypothetical protein
MAALGKRAGKTISKKVGVSLGRSTGEVVPSNYVSTGYVATDYVAEA